MNQIEALLERCRNLGAILTPLEDKLRVEAPDPLPDDILSELRQAKNQIMDELRVRKVKKPNNWLLEEWRKTAIPTWRRILKESIDSGDTGREKYARWMLTDMLDDPEYREENK